MIYHPPGPGRYRLYEAPDGDLGSNASDASASGTSGTSGTAGTGGEASAGQSLGTPSESGGSEGADVYTHDESQMGPDEVPGPPPDAGQRGFRVRDCALIAMATGRRAQNLRELRHILAVIDENSIYHHFWGSRLRASFDDPEYQHDFASWVHRELRDGRMAEKLGVVDPTDFDTLEDLRQELLDLIDERLDEMEQVPWSKTDHQFNFLTSQIVIFDSSLVMNEPRELAEAVPAMSPSSIFYHVIDARRRTPDSVDDFRAWLGGFGDQYADLSAAIAEIDPFFSTLSELRDELGHVLIDYFQGGRHE